MPTTPMYRCEVVVTGEAGAPYYCVGYFDAAAGDASGALGDWITALVGTRLLVPTGTSWDPTLQVPIVDPVTGEIIGIDVATAPAFTGAQDGALLPPANQALVSWLTNTYVGGRQIRGRTNIPCQRVEDADPDGTLSSSKFNQYQARFDAMVASSNSKFVVWSKKNGQWAAATPAMKGEYAVLRSRRD